MHSILLHAENKLQEITVEYQTLTGIQLKDKLCDLRKDIRDKAFNEMKISEKPIEDIDYLLNEFVQELDRLFKEIEDTSDKWRIIYRTLKGFTMNMYVYEEFKSIQDLFIEESETDVMSDKERSKFYIEIFNKIKESNDSESLKMKKLSRLKLRMIYDSKRIYKKNVTVISHMKNNEPILFETYDKLNRFLSSSMYYNIPAEEIIKYCDETYTNILKCLED